MADDEVPAPPPPTLVPEDPSPPVAVAAVRTTTRELLATGDLAALRTHLGDLPSFPNVLDPATGTSVLANAIAVAPLATIRELLRAGARPDNAAADQLPSLIGTLVANRGDRLEVLTLLLDAGADVNQRGVHDWTPLHAAVALDDVEAAKLLVQRGADVTLRTRSDDQLTALEDADRWLRFRMATAIRDAAEARGDQPPAGAEPEMLTPEPPPWPPSVAASSRERNVTVRALCCGWLECDAGTVLSGSTGLFRMPVLSFLVRHPLGLVLFDTGMHPDLVSSPDRLGPLAQWFTPRLDASMVVSAQLRALGVEPTDIAYVVASHLHFDHCGGNGEIPDAHVLVQEAEWEAAHDEEAQRRGTYHPADLELSDDVQLIAGEVDLFGDGTLRIVPTPGHTPGHQSLLVEDRVLLVGDACYCRYALDADVLPPVSYDPDTQRAGFSWLREQEAAGRMLVFSHDEGQWSALPEEL